VAFVVGKILNVIPPVFTRLVFRQFLECQAVLLGEPRGFRQCPPATSARRYGILRKAELMPGGLSGPSGLSGLTGFTIFLCSLSLHTPVSDLLSLKFDAF
jgi:hypothetical protein